MVRKFTAVLKRFFHHPLFLSFYFPSFLFAVAMGLQTPILPLYAGSLSEAYGQIGLVVAGASLGTLIADLPAGYLLRRINKRLSMMLGFLLIAVTSLALVWIHSIWAALALRILTGFGISILSVARHTYISDAVSLEKRGRAISLFGGIMRIGLFIGPALGGVLALKYGLRMPFWFFTGTCVLAALVLLFASGPCEKHVMPAMVSDSPETGLRTAMKGRWGVFTSASAAHILAQITRAGRQLILPLFAADILSLRPDQIGFAISLSSAVSMVMFLPVGQIMDRAGRKLAIVPSFVLMGLGLALLPLVKGYAGLLLLAALIGLGHGFGSGAMMTLGADLSPASARSSFLGVWRWIGDAGNSVGPLVVGLVADYFALPFAALMIAAAGFLAGGVFGVLVPETLKKPPILRHR